MSASDDQERIAETQDELGKLIDANYWRLRIPQQGVRTDIPSPPAPAD